MHYNPCAELSVPPATEGYVFDVGSFYDRVDQLTDKRKARGKRYALALLLTLVVLAQLAGEDTPSGRARPCPRTTPIDARWRLRCSPVSYKS